jgi:hypothetical protein
MWSGLPDGNIAPTDEVATIRQDRKEPKRVFAKMRWGLIPYWAKDISIGAKTINAVCEMAAEKACVSRINEEAPLPDPGRRFLRMEENRPQEEASV